VAATRERQRKLARAKLDRQMARRAAKTRRRRQIQAGVGAAAALLLIVAGSVWLLGGFDRADNVAAPDPICDWTKQDAAANDKLKDVGMPPTTGIPMEGTRPLTITTNQGAPITVTLDLQNAPCAGASLAHLAGRDFFANTACHEITADGALRCGDPSATGLGGPTYSLHSENTPALPAPDPSASAPAKPDKPLYPKGTMALVGTSPGVNGSQFLLFFKDFSPENPVYPIVGKVTGGLDVLAKIGKIPTVDNGSGKKVKPKTTITLQNVTVGPPAPAGAPSPAPSPSPSASNQS
jgi:peptidyl-prolyl cis-trans isomerase B (cyclophilin B)